MEKYLEDGLWKLEIPYIDTELKKKGENVVDVRCTQVWIDDNFVTMHFIDRNDDKILQLAESIKASTEPVVASLKVFNRERVQINSIDWILDFEYFTCTEVEGRRDGLDEFSNYIKIVFRK